MSKEIVSVAEKYLLTINEAASYFNIGAKKMRRIAEEYTGEFSLYSGNRLLINTNKIWEIPFRNFYSLMGFYFFYIAGRTELWYNKISVQ